MALKKVSRAGVGFVRERVHSIPEIIASTALDAGNAKQTHVIRPALVVGKITASGKVAQYAPGASDGTEAATGILLDEVDLKGGDPTADNADKVVDVLLIGSVKESEIIGLDAAAKVDLAGKISFLQ